MIDVRRGDDMKWFYEWLVKYAINRGEYHRRKHEYWYKVVMLCIEKLQRGGWW